MFARNEPCGPQPIAIPFIGSSGSKPESCSMFLMTAYAWGNSDSHFSTGSQPSCKGRPQEPSGLQQTEPCQSCDAVYPFQLYHRPHVLTLRSCTPLGPRLPKPHVVGSDVVKEAGEKSVTIDLCHIPNRLAVPGSTRVCINHDINRVGADEWINDPRRFREPVVPTPTNILTAIFFALFADARRRWYSAAR